MVAVTKLKVAEPPWLIVSEFGDGEREKSFTATGDTVHEIVLLVLPVVLSVSV
jgi:hypothetical protein